ncbi:MAG: hypothetical protein H7Y41_02705 [Hyphomonadaceae bacterium]|nr:hypothetical protein [Clostridia bacterium]
MENINKEALDYLTKLERFCEWLDNVKHHASYDGFVKEGIITRGELRNKDYVSLRRDIVFWSERGWTRTRDWRTILEIRRKEFNEI